MPTADPPAHAGQGRTALVAEVICAGLAAALDLPVPELVTVHVDAALGPAEPDQEIQDLLRASVGRNLGVDYLPRSLGFDPTADAVDPDTAAAIVWFDAVVQNVDRSWRRRDGPPPGTVSRRTRIYQEM